MDELQLAVVYVLILAMRSAYIYARKLLLQSVEKPARLFDTSAMLIFPCS